MRLAIVAIAGAIVLGGAVWLVMREEAPPDVRAARAACDHADRFAAIVAADGSASAARQALSRAIARAREAVALDPRWAPLQSGLETLEVSLAADDPGAANVGTRVVDANCALARER